MLVMNYNVNICFLMVLGDPLERVISHWLKTSILKYLEEALYSKAWGMFFPKNIYIG